MAWRIAPERIVPEAAAELTALFGEAMRTVLLYGSAARAAFRPDSSDINLAVVAEPLTFTHLQRVAQWWARWRRHRFAAPLLLSTSDLARSRDVFPLEFLDIHAYHRTLAGTDLFAQVAVTPECIRTQCEREVKGKLVRLRELYLELADSVPALRRLMLDSRKTFLLVMRGLLHLGGEPWKSRDDEVVSRFERCYGCHLPTLAALDPADADQPLERHFQAYLADIEQLAVLADRALDHRRP
jgi:hypothetical protein